MFLDVSSKSDYLASNKKHMVKNFFLKLYFLMSTSYSLINVVLTKKNGEEQTVFLNQRIFMCVPPIKEICFYYILLKLNSKVADFAACSPFFFLRLSPKSLKLFKCFTLFGNQVVAKNAQHFEKTS